MVESSKAAQEYGDISVVENSPVNQDLRFDNQLMHLYVMTERKVCTFKMNIALIICKSLLCIGNVK